MMNNELSIKQNNPQQHKRERLMSTLTTKLAVQLTSIKTDRTTENPL